MAPVHIEEGGRGDPVVLIHPIGTHGGLWRDIAPRLEGAYRVLAVDLPGHGRSPAGDRPLTIAGMAARVADALAVRDSGPAHVVGLSIGGMVAQELYLQAPELVRSLVLCGTGSGVNEAGAQALRRRADVVDAQGIEAIVEETIERWFSPAFRTRDPGEVARIRAMLLAGDRGIHAECWRAISNFSSVGRLTPGRPALCVYGELEAAAAPATGQTLAKLVGARLVLLPGAAHISPLEDVAGFVEIVKTFLASVPATR